MFKGTKAMTNAFTKAEAALVADIVMRVNVAKSYFLEEPAISEFIQYRVELAAKDQEFDAKAVIELVKERLNAEQ